MTPCSSRTQRAGSAGSDPTWAGVSPRAGTQGHAQRVDGSTVGFELAGAPGGLPLLVCHGLADSRRCVWPLAQAASDLNLLVVAPDRPGVGLTDPRRLECVTDWVSDAAAVLDALGLERAAVLGISGGGPFAAACAARLPSRVSGLLLVCSLGMTEWGSRGVALGERLSLVLATRTPAFGAWFLERLAALARISPRLFLELATVELPQVDRDALRRSPQREAFVEGYLEAFRSGRAGVEQDLRVLRRPWGFSLGSIRAHTWVHHGDADATVSPEHGRRFADAIPGARLRLHAGHGHFSLLTDAAAEILACAG